MRIWLIESKAGGAGIKEDTQDGQVAVPQKPLRILPSALPFLVNGGLPVYSLHKPLVRLGLFSRYPSIGISLTRIPADG